MDRKTHNSWVLIVCFFLSISIQWSNISMWDNIVGFAIQYLHVDTKFTYFVLLYVSYLISVPLTATIAYVPVWILITIIVNWFHPLIKRSIYLIKCESGHLELCISFNRKPPLRHLEYYKNILSWKNIIECRKFKSSVGAKYRFDLMSFLADLYHSDIVENIINNREKLPPTRRYSNMNLNETYFTIYSSDLKEYLLEHGHLGYREALRFAINSLLRENTFFPSEIDFISDSAYNSFENEVKHLISDENIDYVVSMGNFDPDDLEKTLSNYALHRFMKIYPNNRLTLWNYLLSRHPLAELSREALEDEFKV